MLQIKSMIVEIFKSLTIVLLTALFAVIGYAGLNWAELEMEEKQLVTIALIALWFFLVACAAIIWQTIFKLYTEASR